MEWAVVDHRGRAGTHTGVKYTTCEYPSGGDKFIGGIEAVIIKTELHGYWIVPVTDSNEFRYECGMDRQAARAAFMLLTD